MRFSLYFKGKEEPETINNKDFEKTLTTRIPAAEIEQLLYFVFDLFKKIGNLESVSTEMFHPYDYADGYPSIADDAYTLYFTKEPNDIIEVDERIHYYYGMDSDEFGEWGVFDQIGELEFWNWFKLVDGKYELFRHEKPKKNPTEGLDTETPGDLPF